jgi:hypothetical protein
MNLILLLIEEVRYLLLIDICGIFCFKNKKEQDKYLLFNAKHQPFFKNFLKQINTEQCDILFIDLKFLVLV